MNKQLALWALIGFELKNRQLTQVDVKKHVYINNVTNSVDSVITKICTMIGREEIDSRIKFKKNMNIDEASQDACMNKLGLS